VNYFGAPKSAFLIFFFLCHGLFAIADVQKICTDASIESEGQRCTEFLKCARATRVSIVCEYKKRLKELYSLYELKRERLSHDGKPFDVEGYLDKCILNEFQQENDKTSFEFGDRLSKYLAGFKDSHLSFVPKLPLPPVFTGFTVMEIGGRFYIASVNTKLLAYIRDYTNISDLDKVITPGNEVLELDKGKRGTIQNQVKHLEEYISGSSEKFVREEAVASLFQRNFAYPDSNLVNIKIKARTSDKPRNLALPWWTIHSRRADAEAYFSKIKIPTNDRLTWVYGKDGWQIGDEQIEGFSNSQPIVPRSQVSKLTEYKDEKGSFVAARMGIAGYEGKSFCYIQLLTFDTGRLRKVLPEGKLSDGDDEFISVIRNFVKNDCMDAKSSVILDLRENPGGSLPYPEKLLSIFTEADRKYPGGAIAVRTTDFSDAHLSDLSPHRDFAAADLDAHFANLDLDTPLIGEEFQTALKEGKLHTSIFLNREVEADEQVGGFDKKVVLLTTSHCISACDLTAALFSRSGRGIIVGQPTNGTGAGFAGLGDEPQDSWIDTKEYQKLVIPAFLFGVADKLYDEPFLAFDVFKDAILLENRPTKPAPGNYYETTLEDLTGAKGWLNAAMDHI
jgi:hypothetical protein